MHQSVLRSGEVHKGFHAEKVCMKESEFQLYF